MFKLVIKLTNTVKFKLPRAIRDIFQNFKFAEIYPVAHFGLRFVRGDGGFG